MIAERGGNTVPKSPSQPPKISLSTTVAEFRQLLLDLTARASKGDAQALAELLPLLDGSQLSDLLRQHSNLTQAVEDQLLQSAVGQDLLARQMLGRNLAGLRQEMSGESPSPVERLLAEQVVLCWLFLRLAELRTAGRHETYTAEDFYGRQLSRAQGRSLAAVKALLTARKLLRPSPSPLEVATRVVDEAAGARGGRRGARASVGGN
jgi:hypothetical protein